MTSTAPPPRAPPGQYSVLEVTDGCGIRKALAKDGVCIVQGAASPAELAEGEKLWWKFARDAAGVYPDRPETLENSTFNLLGFPKNGVCSKHGAGQSDFMWHNRLLPNVLRSFAHAWNCEKQLDKALQDDSAKLPLVTSFDSMVAWRNPELCSDPTERQSWATTGGWFHLDQSWHTTPGLATYQGILNYFPASAATGSTVLVPGSHARFEEVFQDERRSVKIIRQSTVDFVKLTQPGDYAKYCSTAEQVELGPGDLLLWDSRVIHCAQGVDLSASETEIMGDGREGMPLARLAAYICMVPRSHMRRRKECAAARVAYVKRGLTSGHDPVLPPPPTNFSNASSDYQPPEATSDRWKLV